MMTKTPALATRLVAVPIPAEVAGRIRSDLHDSYGNALVPVVDEEGGSPCRSCLRFTLPGERALLFSYKPFPRPVPYQEVGPVFLHADTCTPYDGRAGFPADFRERRLVLRGYDGGDAIVEAQRYAEPGAAEDLAREMLANPAVAYLHARSNSRGCYLFRLELTR